MANSIIKSIKTIAQSLVDNAGYDKTRGGQIVGVNNITKTYSVKIDGITYPNVRSVDDSTYNIADLVKVVIPCNQATQMYIASSILSDNSLGNKIANATSIAEDAQQLGEGNQQEIADVKKIAESKNKIFRTPDKPTSGMDSGDMWIDTDDGNKLYIWDGNEWVFSGGGDGQNGFSNAAVLLYKRGETAPDMPTGNVTYTFATMAITPISALNGWSQNVPATDGNPCWLIAATATSNTESDTIEASEWTPAIKYVEDGATGATGDTGATGATGVAPEGLVEVIVSTISYPSQTATLKATLFVNGVARTTGITDYHWYRVVGTTTTDLGHSSTMSTLSVSNLNAIYRCVITWT